MSNVRTQRSHQDFKGKSELRNTVVNPLAADPAATTLATYSAGYTWFNTTENRRKEWDGANVIVSANLSDLHNPYRGKFDASTGALPTQADAEDASRPLEAGDLFVISGAGTIDGIIGDDELKEGDSLQYTGGDDTDPANFVGKEGNLKIIDRGTDEQVVGLAADVATTVTSTLTTIESFKVFVGTEDITDTLVIEQTGANTLDITSTIAEAQVTVRMIGKE